MIKRMLKDVLRLDTANTISPIYTGRMAQSRARLLTLYIRQALMTLEHLPEVDRQGKAPALAY